MVGSRLECELVNSITIYCGGPGNLMVDMIGEDMGILLRIKDIRDIMACTVTPKPPGLSAHMNRRNNKFGIKLNEMLILKISL